MGPCLGYGSQEREESYPAIKKNGEGGRVPKLGISLKGSYRLLRGFIGTIYRSYMGGCQNYGPFLGTLDIRGRAIIGIQKRDRNFDNHPYRNLREQVVFMTAALQYRQPGRVSKSSGFRI